MTLYHPAGDSFELTASEWLNLLTSAACNGWQPENPQPAAIPFDLDRSDRSPGTQAGVASRFEIPAGQIMPARVASRLASALRKKGAVGGIDEGWLVRFCGFCESGQSLLLSEYAPLPDTHKPVPEPAPISMESQLLNLSHSLSSGPTVKPQPLGPHMERDLEPAHRR